MQGNRIRIAVSGTYSSGKTTTSEVLSVATGIPLTDTLTAREILMDLLPGRRLEDLSAPELMMLGVRRLEERIQGEARLPGSFISDGSVLHEWIYGAVRTRVGINPGAPFMDRAVRRVLSAPIMPFLKRYMYAYGEVMKARAKRTYDVFVHLPVEFEMERDGYRPGSEKYRTMADQMLRDALEELKLPYYVVGGTVQERVERIVELLDLPLVMPVDEAIPIATARISCSRDMIAGQQLALKKRVSLWERAKYATRV
jgi:AAA domain